MFTKKSLMTATAAAALMFSVGAANASLLTITGGTSFFTPNTNDVLGIGFGPLFDNAGLTATAGSVLSYYFMGSESGYKNTLTTSGGNSYTELNTIPTPPTPAFPGVFLFSEVYNGVTPVFSFTTDPVIAPNPVSPGTGTASRSIALTYLNADYTVSVDGSGNPVATDIVLFTLDDSGAGPDDNHDDFVGYIKATPVPLPAAVWLFGSALMGIAGLGYRRNQKA